MPIKIYSEKDPLDEDVRIEIVPLIDVIFCLLTFFILAAVTLTRQTAINVDLPQAGSGETQMRQLLIVSVDPIGQTYLEKQPVSRSQLQQALVQFRQTNPDGLMVLYASRAASYDDVVQVLDLLRQVGGDRVALATLPGSGETGGLEIPGALPGGTLPGDPNNPLNNPLNIAPLPNSSPGLNLSPLPGLSPGVPAAPGSSGSSPGGASGLPGAVPGLEAPSGGGTSGTNGSGGSVVPNAAPPQGTP